MNTKPEQPENSTQPKRIGELFVESNMLAAADLQKGLDYGKKTGLPLGRVLVMLRLVDDADLRAVLQVQSLQKFEGLPGALAIKSLSTAREKGISLDDALKQLGWQSDKFKAAMPERLRELKTALADTEARLGADHADVAALLLQLAEFYESEDMWPHAESQCQLAIAKMEKAYGKTDLHVANACAQLGTLLFQQDRFDEAQAQYLRVLEIKQHILGSDHPELLVPLRDLAETYDIQKRYGDAEAHYLQCLQIMERTEEPDDPRVLELLKRLSFVCRRRSRAQDQVLIGDLLTASGLIPSEKIPEALAYSKANGVPLARALVLMNLLSEEALRPVLHAQLLMKSNLLPAPLAPRALKVCFKRGVPIEEGLQIIGWSLPGRVSELHELLKTNDELVQAERELPAEHPQIAELCLRLADLFEVYDRFGEAEPLYKRALAIIEQTEQDTPRIMDTLDKLGCVYLKQLKFEQADSLFKRVLEMRMQILGKEHEDVGQSYLNLGRLYTLKNDHNDASIYLGRALSTIEKKFGSHHPQVAEVVEQMAICFFELGEHDRAEPLFWQAYKIKKEYLTDDNHEIISLLTRLAEMYNKDGKFAMADSVLAKFHHNKSVLI